EIEPGDTILRYRIKENYRAAVFSVAEELLYPANVLALRGRLIEMPAKESLERKAGDERVTPGSFQRHSHSIEQPGRRDSCGESRFRLEFDTLHCKTALAIAVQDGVPSRANELPRKRVHLVVAKRRLDDSL